MKQLATILNKFTSYFLILLMASLVVDVTWQVIARYILGAPSSYTEEIARFILIWIGLIGAAHVLHMRMHIGIDLLVNKLSDKMRHITSALSWITTLSFAFFVLTVGGFYLVILILDLEQTSAALGIKMGYVYIAIPISGILMSIYSIPPLYDACKLVFKGDH